MPNSNMEEIANDYQEIRTELEQAIAGTSMPPFPGEEASRGIVICGGGTRYFTNAWVAIKLLRFHGCELPVELWALDEEELDEAMRGLAESLGVAVRYAGEALSGAGKESVPGRWQWALKPHAIVHSAFDEVLYLDADNLPVRDPSDLFECATYRAEGSLFWPDIGMTEKERPIWSVMDIPYRPEPEFETGQMLIHKWRCWEPLQLALWMNLRSEIFYEIIWGDKDTFRFAWHKFGRPFGMVPYSVQTLGLPGDQEGIGAMCQHDFDGNWLFQHRNMAKWHLLAENPRIPGFLFEPECREFLAELREQWNGKVNGAQQKDDIPTRVHQELEETSRDLQEGVWLLEDRRPRAAGCCQPVEEWTDVRVRHPWQAPIEEITEGGRAERSQMIHQVNAEGLRCRELTFLSDSIGRGASAEFCWWDLKPGPGGIGFVLELHGEDQTTIALEFSRDGSWRGWVEDQEGTSHTLRLLRSEQLYPEQDEAEPLNGNRPGEPVHVANHAFGIGDAITGLYAAVGLVEAGASVIYHTRHPEWFSRANVPGLTITSDEPPVGSVDLNADYSEQIRYAGDKSRWYAMLGAAALPKGERPGIAAPPFAPGRPRLDLALLEPILDVTNYVLLAPFTARETRDWPDSHWRRLAFLLSEAGYEVVAMGLKQDEKRLQRTFEKSYAYWVVDQSPEWVMAAMLGAECVIGPDSGMIHLAGLLGVPAVCIHSHLPPSFLFGQAPSVFSASPGTECVFCRWQKDAGYNDSCADACAALASVTPEQVLEMVQSEKIANARSELRGRVEEDTERVKRESDGSAVLGVGVVENKADVIAYTLQPNCGMGEAAETNIQAMRALGFTVEHRQWQGDLVSEPALQDPDQIFYHHWHPHAQLPIDMWRLYVPPNGTGARHIAYWAYEIENDLPQSFHQAAFFLTEVWTPSTFCQGIFEATGLPVQVVPHAVPSVEKFEELPSAEGKAPFTVLTMFDAWSRFGRKNPQAAIRVFQRAFPHRHDVRLLLKGRYLRSEELRQLQEDCGWDSRIRVVNESLSESERDRLFASADVYLGLQRSEGFGLNLARSLGMGLPVITTGWSGLTDFCTADNAFLVPYALEKARDHDEAYEGEGIWAQPDENTAAIYLASVAEMAARKDERLRQKRENGRTLIQQRFGAEALQATLKSRFEELGVLSQSH